MSKNKENSEKKAVVELHIDSSLKNVWVDNLHMAVRDDNVCVIRLSTSLPEGVFEQLRFMTNRSQLEEFVEILCATMNYYPQKDKTPSLKKNKPTPSKKPA
jgi:hypothetical protein